MEISSGNYTMRFQDGGLEVLKDGAVLYFNRRPMYAFIKLPCRSPSFMMLLMDEITVDNGCVTAKGILKSRPDRNWPSAIFMKLFETCFRIRQNRFSAKKCRRLWLCLLRSLWYWQLLMMCVHMNYFRAG